MQNHLHSWVSFIINFDLNRPATNSVTKIISLFDAGMSVARLNMQHGSTKVSDRFKKSFR